MKIRKENDLLFTQKFESDSLWTHYEGYDRIPKIGEGFRLSCTPDKHIVACVYN